MLVKEFKENLEGKDYVVGDIHGCFTKLECELYTLGFDSTKDRLFSVGDLVDRGPESEKVLEWLAKPWFHSVRGNHEQMTIDGYHDKGGNASALHAMNGGFWFYNMFEQDQREIAIAFGDLPIAITIKTLSADYGIVHAQPIGSYWGAMISRLKALDSVAVNTCLWGRTKIERKDTTKIRGVDYVYCGHTPRDEITILGNTLYIDTGAVYAGGKLTILEIGKI